MRNKKSLKFKVLLLVGGFLAAFFLVLITPPVRTRATSFIDLSLLFSKKEFSKVFELSQNSDFLYEITKANYKAYFGNKTEGNSNKVEVEKEGKSLSFSFIKTESTASPSANELNEPENEPESDLVATQFSLSQTQVLSFTSQIEVPENWEEIEKQVEEISTQVAELQKKFAEIKTDVKKIPLKATFLIRENEQEVIKNLEVAPGTDLAYYAKDNKIKEKIILKDKTAANSFIFELNLTNLVPRFNGEVWEFIDLQTENQVFYFEKPFMDDSGGNHSENVILEIYQENGKNYAKITADRDWLLDQNRVYPVIIDPTVASSVPSGSTANNFQRKTLYDPINNTYWVGILASDSYIYFYYSKDGRTWTNAGTGSRTGDGIVGGSNQWSLWPAIESGSTYVYLIGSAGYQMRAYKGTVGSTSITWSAAKVVDCGAGNNRPFISKSSNGYVWLIINFWTGTQYDLTVLQSTNQNDTSAWGSCTAIRSNFNTMYQLILPNGQDNNNMIAIYSGASGTPATLYYQTYSGTWSGVGTISSTLITDPDWQHFSCLNDSSYNIHCIFIDQYYEVQYTKYTTSWTTTALTSNTTSNDCTLSYSPGNGYLYAFYSQSSTYYLKIYDGSSWSNQIDTKFSEGTSPNYITSNFSSDNRQGDNGRIFAIWSNTDSSNSVMFGRIYEVAAPVESMRHGKFFHEGAEQKMTW